MLYAKGVTNDSVFISRVLTALREFMEADGLAFAYDRFISPRTGLIQFASTFSRSVTGSMNELIDHGKLLLADEEKSPFDLGFRLNDTLLSAVESAEEIRPGDPPQRRGPYELPDHRILSGDLSPTLGCLPGHGVCSSMPSRRRKFRKAELDRRP